MSKTQNLCPPQTLCAWQNVSTRSRQQCCRHNVSLFCQPTWVRLHVGYRFAGPLLIGPPLSNMPVHYRMWYTTDDWMCEDLCDNTKHERKWLSVDCTQSLFSLSNWGTGTREMRDRARDWSERGRRPRGAFPYSPRGRLPCSAPAYQLMWTRKESDCVQSRLSAVAHTWNAAWALQFWLSSAWFHSSPHRPGGIHWTHERDTSLLQQWSCPGHCEHYNTLEHIITHYNTL